jgi:hypothetical protein
MNERGTCVAMYNYAHYNETLLGNKSFFIYDSQDSRNEKDGLNLIKNRFDTYDINFADYNIDNVSVRTSKLDLVLEERGADYIYIVKNGWNDGLIPTKAKLLVHCVGMVDPKESHGHRWAYCSNFSSNANSNGSVPAVPYMVDLPEEPSNMREVLGVDNNQVVIGRHGGFDTFNIPLGIEVIKSVVEARSNLCFLFLNTPKFIEHERVIFLDKIVDTIEKVKFINSCDAMLHLRREGETFGMAPAEFSIRNKPVMTFSGSPERNHIDILGDKGLYYDSPQKLFDLLMTFEPEETKDWNCYRDYCPEKIMQIFNKVYLS